MYSINEAKMFFDIADGQAIVINFETGMYYGMSSLASAVIERLVEGDSLGAIVEGLRACEGCPEDIDARMEAFISQLLAKEVLVGDPDGGNEAAPAFEKTAFEDGFTLTLDEYAEAMDLILADPIHDVDVDMGWPIMKES